MEDVQTKGFGFITAESAWSETQGSRGKGLLLDCEYGFRSALKGFQTAALIAVTACSSVCHGYPDLVWYLLFLFLGFDEPLEQEPFLSLKQLGVIK